jgi:curved DNA-binding protein CbpA
MSADPYSTLGIERDATPEQIKEAYRRKAMEAHPDRGGSTDDMARINAAYDTLSDPKRRAMYDQTGNMSEPQSVESKAASMLAQVFASFIDGGGSQDFLRSAKSVFEVNIDNANKQMAKAKKRVATLSGKLGAVTSRTQINLFDGVLRDRIAQADREIEQLGDALLTMNAAVKMLDDYSEAQPDGGRPTDDHHTHQLFIKSYRGAF